MWGIYSYLYLKDLMLGSIQGDMHKKSESVELRGPGCLDVIGEMAPKTDARLKEMGSLVGTHEVHSRHRRTTRGRGLHRMVARSKRTQ